MESNAVELQLLLACARVHPSEEGDAAIRQMLDEGIDWTRFAQIAINYGLAGLAGHTLTRVAPDVVPDDILGALSMIIDQTRRTNRALFEKFADTLETLAGAGFEVIALKGPAAALQAYGDLGLRVIGGMDLLVHDIDLGAVTQALLSTGYAYSDASSRRPHERFRHHSRRDALYAKGAEIGIKLHTRLAPIKMVLDIDYAGLWGRARRTNLNGRSMLMLAPEDDALTLAIHGGKELWWNIKWACDFAVFIGSHPQLDWPVVAERARLQGCLRMLLLATSLARRYLYANLPPSIIAAERADTVIVGMGDRIVAGWRADKSVGPPDNKTLSMDRFLLHDGTMRRARYAMNMMPAPRDILTRLLSRASQQVSARAVRWQEALASSALPLAVIPASATTKSNIRRHREARAEARHALAINPKSISAWRDLGDALSGLKRYKEAVVSYEKALVISPDHSGIWAKRRGALMASGTDAYFPDIAINPLNANAWAIRAGRFVESHRFGEALEAVDQALLLDSDHVAAMRMGIHSRLQSCGWSRREDDKQRIAAGLSMGTILFQSVDHRGLCDSEQELRTAAQFVVKKIPASEKVLWNGERYDHDKIRIAYVSSDLRTHAVASLIVGCFEHHDKARFETTAVSLYPGDGSAMRQRLENAFDHFIDAKNMNDVEIAKMLRASEIDIVIDLNGYTGFTRDGIFVRRPAPVQVNFLGYPGTMGATFIDYIIADHTVIPAENRVHYSEKIAYLPHTYMPCDRNRPIAEQTPSRMAAELPETGFVFACLNYAYKIGPEVFDVWMRLLRSVEGSVLWLRSTNATALANLRREADVRGVNPDRLLFAPPVAQEEDHLARLRLADLFLDTVPYNAHATASDALWAGLPVVTCPGNTFPGRVAASLLHAVGLPELVTASLAEYEELARTLAQDPLRLAAIRAKLKRNRETEPLFDTARFTRDLETAYTTMWERQQAGLPPVTFDVPNTGRLRNAEP